MTSRANRVDISFLILLPIILLLVGCGQEESGRAASIPTVNYLSVTQSAVTLTRELSGRTTASVISEVRPQVGGLVRERLFTEGAEVAAGEVLYQIDPAPYQAAYDRARAALMNAEAELVATELLARRYGAIVEKQAISRQEYDNAVTARDRAAAGVALAKAELESAAINLNNCRVTAPVSGRIGRSTVTPGALVTQNQAEALTTVRQLDPIYVDLTQSSAELLRLKEELAEGRLKSGGEGAVRVSLILENGRPYTSANKPVEGRLEFADATVDPDTGAVSLRATFPNPDGLLLPGMYVRAVLEEGVNEQAVLAPQKAVSRDNRGQAVARVLTPDDAEGAEGLFKVESRVVEIDRAMDNQWLIAKGLEPGELLMVEGGMRVRTGQSVKAVPEQTVMAKAESTTK